MKAFDRENSVWARFSEEQRLEMEEYSKKYRQFLDTARTERLANAEIIRQAEAAGFRPLSDYTSLKAGDKVYWNQKGKSVILAVIGTEPVSQGMKIVGSHIDCPRLDLKAMPVTEKNGIVYFKTHYYGGLLKYQWVCLPLSLIGVVYTAD
ncbi:MAG TPA: aminopeptidase, partial [Megasphaera sp.]|nr:aminopeptidase [Megasphaera sp.]